MRKLARFLPVLAVAAFLAGCEGPCSKIDVINGPALTGGSADLSIFASVGTSISAGYQSGGVVNRHQVHAFPALFAGQVGKTVLADGNGDFTFNGIGGDGLQPLLEIKSLSPLVINNTGRTPGTPLNTAQATSYHNLAVPGQVAYDMVDGSRYGTGLFPLVYRGMGTGISQLIARAPTFVSFEFGANEVLATATAGDSTNPAIVGSFAPSVTACLNAINGALPNTKIAVFNVPNVTSIPYFTTFPPVTVSLTTGAPVGLIGRTGGRDTTLNATDLVLLPAASLLATGTGFPVGGYNYVNPSAPGNGNPLPDALVLDVGEQADIAAAIQSMNTTLQSLVAARPYTTLVDLNGLLADIASDGFPLGATTYTADFVTGGLFSLDGVHPTDLAHAILCNALIDAVNAKWDATVPRVNVAQHATGTSSRMHPAIGGGPSMPRQIGGLDEAFRALYGSLR